MPLPAPSPGLVVRYDYLWSRESAQGRSQGKDRPACIVVASDSAATPRFVVLVPITHSPPRGGDVGIEIPPRVRNSIGLDEAPAWIIVSEHNVDEWPNAGLVPLPGKPDVFAYGFLPPTLFAEVRKQFIECAELSRSAPVIRNP